MDAKVKLNLSHFINGKKVDGISGRFGDVYNPAIGEVVKLVPLASAAEVRTAIASAAAAFPAWAETPPGRRAQVLYRYRELLHQHIDELAEIVSEEHGKTLDDVERVGIVGATVNQELVVRKRVDIFRSAHLGRGHVVPVEAEREVQHQQLGQHDHDYDPKEHSAQHEQRKAKAVSPEKCLEPVGHRSVP